MAALKKTSSRDLSMSASLGVVTLPPSWRKPAAKFSRGVVLSYALYTVINTKFETLLLLLVLEISIDLYQFRNLRSLLGRESAASPSPPAAAVAPAPPASTAPSPAAPPVPDNPEPSALLRAVGILSSRSLALWSVAFWPETT